MASIMAPMMAWLEQICAPKSDSYVPSCPPRPELPEQDRQVWRANCAACDFIAEGTESLARHEGRKHRKETGHHVWFCFDLLGVGVGWL